MISATQALELFNTRQSVRNYTSQQVDEEVIERCIEAARLAPSACNSQPWKFIVVTDTEIRQQLDSMLVTPPLGMNKFAAEAPVLVVVVRENPNLTSKIGELLRDKTYTLMDVGMATLQFCLQATAEGLGTCIMGWFNEKQVKKLLNIPSSKRAELVISMGYPKNEEIRPKQRKAKDVIYSKNHY
jgi:nitroreductase